MTFSILLGTLDRPKTLEYCLESFMKQSFQDFEVVIVDQSSGTETKDLTEKLGWDKIKYIRTDEKGLSKARNIAIKASSGEFLCLADDDAYYDKQYLETVLTHLKEKGDKAIISGHLWNGHEKKEFVQYSKLRSGEDLTYRNITRYCPSPAITIPAGVINEAGNFDERFGVGAKYSAAEETDLLVRAKKAGYHVYYFSDVKAEHPHVKAEKNDSPIDKGSIYSYGTGAMFKKNSRGKSGNMIKALYLEKALRSVMAVMIKKTDSMRLNDLIRGYREYR